MASWLQHVDERHALESAWCRVSKFAFLNGLGGAELARALKNSSEADGVDRDLIRLIGDDMTWLVSTPSRRELSTNPAGRPFQAAYEAMVSRETVRYCPECLLVGFHSLIFQAFGVRSCPFHGSTLLDACTHCGERLQALDTVRKETFVPLHCAACRAPLCDFSRFEEVFTTGASLKPVLDCFQLLSSRIEECIRMDTSELSLELSPNTQRHAGLLPLLWAIHFSSDLPVFFEPLPALCWGPLLRRQSYTARKISRNSEEFRGAARLFRIGTAAARGLDKALLLATGRIQSHAQRHSPSLGYVLWDETEKFILTVRPAKCACCETLVHWRATQAGLFRAIERLPRLAPSLRDSIMASRSGDWPSRGQSAAFFRRTAVQRAIACLWDVTEGSMLLCGYQKLDLAVMHDVIDGTSAALLGEDHEMLQEGVGRGLFTTQLDGVFLQALLKEAANADPNREDGEYRRVTRSAWHIETGSIASRLPRVDPWVPGLEVREQPKRLRRAKIVLPHEEVPSLRPLRPKLALQGVAGSVPSRPSLLRNTDGREVEQSNGESQRVFTEICAGLSVPKS